jgi:hypothetical protein
MLSSDNPIKYNGGVFMKKAVRKTIMNEIQGISNCNGNRRSSLPVFDDD